MIKRRAGDTGSQNDPDNRGYRGDSADELDVAKNVLKILIIVGIIFWLTPFMLFGEDGLNAKIVADDIETCQALPTTADQSKCLGRLGYTGDDSTGAAGQISTILGQGKSILMQAFDVIKIALVVGAIGTIAYMYVGPKRLA